MNTVEREMASSEVEVVGAAARVCSLLSGAGGGVGGGVGDGYVDWYEVFGLSAEEVTLLGREDDAGIAALRRAFRKLAVRLHPDRCKEACAGEAFAGVRKGYEMLIGASGADDVSNHVAAADADAATQDARTNRRQFHVEWLLRRSQTDEERARDERAKKATAPGVSDAFKEHDGYGRCRVCHGVLVDSRGKSGLDFLACACSRPTPWTCGCGFDNGSTRLDSCPSCGLAKGSRYDASAVRSSDGGEKKRERDEDGAGVGAGGAGGGGFESAPVMVKKKSGFKRPKRRKQVPPG